MEMKQTETERIRIDCVADLMQDLGIVATREQIEQLTADVMTHLDMEREMSSYQHVGRKEKCDKCEAKDMEIKDLQHQVKVYNNSVKQRRNAEHVWIENETVKYE